MSSFTCITCRVAFQDADLQRSHYKTDWHRYNLKRKVADMPPVTAENFQERLLAQKAQVESEKKDTSSHCAVCNKHFSNENQYNNHVQSKKHKDAAAREAQTDTVAKGENPQVAAKNAKNMVLKAELGGEKSHAQTKESRSDEAGPSGSTSSPSHTQTEEHMEMDDDDSDSGSWESWEGDALSLEECLFCSHLSSTLEKNIKHMTLSHSFFLPDMDYVSNLEGLVTYLDEKVGEGHICLWCNSKSKAFRTTKAVQQHMLDKGHCKMLHDGDTVFEYADYYDYRTSYPDFAADKDGPMEEGDEGEEAVEELDGEGFQMVLPSGSVIGHRSLQRYFRQKLRPDRTVALKNSASISKVLAQYKSLGWTGTAGQMAQVKAKDMAQFHRIRKQKYMQLGVKANKLMTHFRAQILGC